MHGNQPLFNLQTISDYSEYRPRINAKNGRPLGPLVHRSQNGIAIAAFPHPTQNKLQIRGMFLTSTQRGVFSPQPPRNPPQIHHKNTTQKRDVSRNPLKKHSKNTQSAPHLLPRKKSQKQ
jgi:hypothetical protein